MSPCRSQGSKAMMVLHGFRQQGIATPPLQLLPQALTPPTTLPVVTLHCLMSDS